MCGDWPCEHIFVPDDAWKQPKTTAGGGLPRSSILPFVEIVFLPARHGVVTTGECENEGFFFFFYLSASSRGGTQPMLRLRKEEITRSRFAIGDISKCEVCCCASGRPRWHMGRMHDGSQRTLCVWQGWAERACSWQPIASLSFFSLLFLRLKWVEKRRFLAGRLHEWSSNQVNEAWF